MSQLSRHIASYSDERFLGSFLALRQTQLRQVVEAVSKELQQRMANVTMPVEQTHEAMLRFQEEYKDLRRELDLMQDLEAILDRVDTALSAVTK